MSLTIPKGVLEQIRFETNYKDYEASLLTLDEGRFRGLGEEHTRNFIRHATGYCDAIKLNYMGEVVYVMFIMSFLGSFFYEDLRYSKITKILSDIPNGYDNRIDAARDQFITVGNRFLGEGLGLYLADLKAFTSNWREKVSSLDAHEFIAGLTSSHAERSYRPQPEHVEHMLAEGLAAASALDLHGQRAANLCVGLGYWLGVGFYKDPLFPWVRDKAREGGEHALEQYVDRRLAHQIRVLEDNAA